MQTICFFRILFLLGLISELLPAQNPVHEFEIADDIRAQLIIKKGDLSVVIFPDEKKQIILKNAEKNPEILFEDINGDGFTDIFLNFQWKYGHKKGRIFLFHPDISSFKEFEINNTCLLDTEFIGPKTLRIRQSIFPSCTDNWKTFSFNQDFEVSLTMSVETLRIPGADLDLSKKIQYGQGNESEDLFLIQYGQAIEDLYAYVFAEKTELYEKPEFNANSLGYLIKDDEFLILDFTSDNWLKIRFYNENLNKYIEGWINATELILNKYGLEFGGDHQEENINLSLLYPYYEEKSMFVFTIGMTNNSSSSFSIASGRICILLENPAGRRYLYDLYGTHSEMLPPKSLKETYGKSPEGKWYSPSILLDDNTVEWDDEFKKFLIYHGINEEEVTYLQFIPDTIPAGTYKMYAVFYKPFSYEPAIVSNPQQIEIPFPKLPPSNN